MVSNLDDNNKDVKDITEITEDGLFKCKICGVKFDNTSAYEGHIAAGHLTPPLMPHRITKSCIQLIVQIISLRIYGGRENGVIIKPIHKDLHHASKQPERP